MCQNPSLLQNSELIGNSYNYNLKLYIDDIGIDIVYLT